jgi:hypothetical protein
MIVDGSLGKVRTEVVARYGSSAAASRGFTMNFKAAAAVMVFMTDAEGV